jgi:hypothetical protein
MLAFALCARSKDNDIKKAAYELLPEICRIPTHLFMFVKYCEQEGREEGAESGKSAEKGTESGKSSNRRANNKARNQVGLRREEQ